MFSNLLSATKNAPHFTITKISLLTLFKEVIPIYIENKMKHKEWRLTGC
jgi:hypothetical protein